MLRVVILAAGASARLGEPKALALLGGRSVLEHLVQACRAVDPRPILVVGAHAEAIAAAAPGACELLHNPHWDEGRSSGVALACRRLPGWDVCLAPVDVPLVPSTVFAALSQGWERAGSPPRGWLAPYFRPQRRHGHPVVLGRDLLAELEETAPLSTLRTRAAPLLEVPVDSPEVLDDLDTPADLARLRARIR